MGDPGSGAFVAILPEAAEDLAAVMQRDGLDALDLLARVRRALAEGGESAPAAEQALGDAGEWGQQAAADLRWRIETMVALDRGYVPGGMASGLLPFASRQAYARVVHLALEGLGGVLADPVLRGDARARAAAVARWAAGLGSGVLEVVVLEAPDLLGNLDGIPVATRYAINRDRVDAELARVKRQLAGPLDPDSREALEVRQATLTELAGPGADGQARQLLAFDPAGDGMAVEVVGDLAAAEHVAVLVPGIGTELEDFAGLTRNAANLQRNAQLNYAAPGDQVATVAWFGYDTPPGTIPQAAQAASTASARLGAPQLVDFMAGQRLDGVHTTVIGHSYGSVVTGHALAAGLAVDDAVVIGSPGVGQGVSADDLRPEGGELYAMRTADDAIRFVDGHGGDPTNADFGAVVLAANPSRPDRGYDTIAGHSGYYTPNSLALDNLTAVTVDQPDLLIAQIPALHNPLSAGPLAELPTTLSDSFREGLDNVLGGFAEPLDEQAH